VAMGWSVIEFDLAWLAEWGVGPRPAVDDVLSSRRRARKAGRHRRRRKTQTPPCAFSPRLGRVGQPTWSRPAVPVIAYHHQPDSQSTKSIYSRSPSSTRSIGTTSRHELLSSTHHLPPISPLPSSTLPLFRSHAPLSLASPSSVQQAIPIHPSVALAQSSYILLPHTYDACPLESSG
jgi:hypothetical protein